MNRMERRRSGNNGMFLPVLPGVFWQAFENVEMAWRDLGACLKDEWDAMSRGDIPALWEITDKKNMKADRIQKAEQGLSRLVDLVVGRCGKSNSDGDRWNIIRRSAHPSDVSRLDAVISSLRRTRGMVLDRNRRHLSWVRERLDITRHLIGVISFREEISPGVYGPSASMSADEKWARAEQGVNRWQG